MPKRCAAVKAVLGDNCRFVEDRKPRFPVLLADADEIFVTADSVSMVSEAILTGKPVGMIPIELSALRAPAPRRDALRAEPASGDLRRFWDEPRGRGMIGTIDAPVSLDDGKPGELPPAAKVLRLLGR